MLSKKRNGNAVDFVVEKYLTVNLPKPFLKVKLLENERQQRLMHVT